MLIYFLLCLFWGFFEASFGAWKDTLFEPFDFLKFFRSPLIVFLSGALFWKLFDHQNVFVLSIAAVSAERLLTEGWKASIRKPPGKFKRNNRDTGWLKERFKNGTL